jgi:hypothetical protein
MLTKAQLLKQVRESIKKWNPPEGDFEMRVLEKNVKKRDDCWYVPIYPTRPPKRNYHFVDSLAEVETELRLDKKLKIQIFPAFLE